MTRSETIHFLQKIKSYYQNFIIEDYVVNEWADRLKPYSADDVYRKFDEHLNGERKNEIPKIHFITRFLKTPEQKKASGKINIRCSVCGSIVDLSEHGKHLARHNSIAYIKQNEKRIGKVLNEDKLFEANDAEFDRLYQKFLEEIYVISKSQSEKERIEKIIFTVE